MACPCSIRRWVRGSLLGAGSFGTVHLALNAATGELFAVKSVDCSSRRSEITAIENEMRLLQSLDSAFVIRCFGGDETCENGTRRRNLFMEYMAGGSLADLMRKFGGALDEGLIRVYARGILEGLEYLHAQGVVHCDIKGKNILIGGTGIKIADFGSAKRVGQQVEAMRGTPLWMAPEVILQEEQGPPSDVWSLGCTIVEMATGRPPWSHPQLSPLAALMKIGSMQAIPALPDCLSPDAKDFLSKCLHRDPSQRRTASELLQHPFVQKPTIEEGPRLCKHHAEAAVVAAMPPLSPTSVLDAGDVGGDGTGSWEGNRRSVPLLHCPNVGEAHAGAMAETEYCPNVDERKGGWITVRSPRPAGEERQRPLSSFMLLAGPPAAVAALEAAAAGSPAASASSLQFLRVPRRPPLSPASTWRVPHQQPPLLELIPPPTSR